jgi:hypothetical protein
MANPYDPYEQQIIGFEQKKRFAEKLREQALTPQQGQMVSGWYVSPGIAGALVQGLKGYMANKKEREAEQGIKDVMGERTAQREQLLGQMPRSQTSENRTDFEAMGPQMSQTVQPKTEDYLAWAGKMSSVDPAMAQMGMQYANLSEGREQRKSELATRIAENRASAQEKREFQEAEAKRNREWRSQESEAGRRQQESMARLAQALRPAPQPHTPVSVIGPDGKPVYVSPGQAVGMTPANADKPLNEFQGKSLTFGTRAADAHNILNALESTNPNAIFAANKTGTVGEYFASPEVKRALQAQRNFVNAVLRQESGAAIGKDEFDNARKQYFPQPGDDQSTIDQKKATRERVIQGFAKQAGPGGQDVLSIYNAPPALSPPKNQPPALPAADAIAAEIARRQGRQ